MNKINIIAMAIAALMLFAAGSIVGYTLNSNPQGQALLPIIPDYPVKFFTEDNNNSTVVVTTNTTFLLLLDENPTTGYTWNLSHTEGLSIIEDNYTHGGAGRIGAGGIRVWEIKATGHGSQTLNASYERSWEPTADDEQFVLNVVIHYPDENGAA